MNKEEFKKLGRLFLAFAVILGAVISILTLVGSNESVRKYLAGFFIVILGLFGAMNIVDSDLNSDIIPESEANLVMVVRVVDGDTIVIDGDVYVRLLGIDAPEGGECFYEESKDALVSLIQGEYIRLEKDVSDKDNFGRLLRYVFLSNNNLFVNNRLLDEGYADVMSSGQDLLYRRLLTSSRNQAITQRKGIWGACENQEKEAETIFPLEKNDISVNPECLIKGNISEHGYGKVYFSPGDPNYNQVKVSFDKGEQFFCTEQEAEAAGFMKNESW